MIWGEEKELSSVHHFSCPEKQTWKKKMLCFLGEGVGYLRFQVTGMI